MKKCNIHVPLSHPLPEVEHGAYQWRAKDLIHWLQAYDLLMTANEYGHGLVVDEGRLETIKFRLQRATRNFCVMGSGILGSLQKKNNHTLITAAALGLAAVVLNECGDGRLMFNWHPKRWANMAHWYIENTLFGPNWVEFGRMSSKDGSAGYAEGPHYFTYAFDLCLDSGFKPESIKYI